MRKSARKYYRVLIYKQTILKEWHLEKKIIYYDLYEAIGEAINLKNKETKIIVEETNTIYEFDT